MEEEPRDAWGREPLKMQGAEKGGEGSRERDTGDRGHLPDGGEKSIGQAQMPLAPEAFHVGFSSATHVVSCSQDSLHFSPQTAYPPLASLLLCLSAFSMSSAGG